MFFEISIICHFEAMDSFANTSIFPNDTHHYKFQVSRVEWEKKEIEKYQKTEKLSLHQFEINFSMNLFVKWWSLSITLWFVSFRFVLLCSFFSFYSNLFFFILWWVLPSKYFKLFSSTEQMWVWWKCVCGCVRFRFWFQIISRRSTNFNRFQPNFNWIVRKDSEEHFQFFSLSLSPYFVNTVMALWGSWWIFFSLSNSATNQIYPKCGYVSNTLCLFQTTIRYIREGAKTGERWSNTLQYYSHYL